MLIAALMSSGALGLAQTPPALDPAAVETLCQSGVDAAAHPGFIIVPAQEDAPCHLRADMDYAWASATAHALLDWAQARGLPWTVRDRNGPVDAWDGPWFRAYNRGGLYIRVEYVRPADGGHEPAPDSPARLLIAWRPRT